MPWAVSGMSTMCGVVAAVVVVGAHEQQAGELAVGAGRRLQRRAVEAGDLGQPAAQRVHELERPLDELLGLVGVQAAQALRRAATRSLILGLYFIVHEPSGYGPFSTP